MAISSSNLRSCRRRLAAPSVARHSQGLVASSYHIVQFDFDGELQEEEKRTGMGSLSSLSVCLAVVVVVVVVVVVARLDQCQPIGMRKAREIIVFFFLRQVSVRHTVEKIKRRGDYQSLIGPSFIQWVLCTRCIHKFNSKLNRLPSFINDRYRISKRPTKKRIKLMNNPFRK